MTVVAIMVAEFLDLWMNVVSSHVKDQRIKTTLDRFDTSQNQPYYRPPNRPEAFHNLDERIKMTS